MRRMHKAPLVKGGWHSEAVTGGFSLTTNVCGELESLHRLAAVPILQRKSLTEPNNPLDCLAL